MRAGWTKFLETNVPRYTSYPSALAFSAQVGPDEHVAALRQIGAYELTSLYLHVPFCRQLCWYCGCNMRVERQSAPIAAYTDLLIAELRLIGQHLRGHGRLTQIHFGGGTPNTLSANDISRVLTAVEAFLGLNGQTPIAMEIDPRLCSPVQAAQLARLGISRISIGVQDFAPEVQLAINREQPFALVADCVARLREAGIADISFDLLYGLPHQTVCRFRQTLTQAISLAPDRVSLFGYAHLPARLPHQRLIKTDALPGRALRATLAEIAAAQLVAAGYERVGFDHFARPETSIATAARNKRLNRNFQGFTDDCADVVIGAGLSAISSVHGVLSQNTKDLRTYERRIRADAMATDRGVIATPDQQRIGNWISSLLCDMRASLPQYLAITQTEADAFDRVLIRLQPFLDEDVVSVADGDLIIHAEATPLARVVAALFDPSVGATAGFASPAV